MVLLKKQQLNGLFSYEYYIHLERKLHPTNGENFRLSDFVNKEICKYDINKVLKNGGKGLHSNQLQIQFMV